ncbi:MAG: TolC family protein [Elusimicrobia bacterium]|nr:TolC family protein [Elusimicrobiota bacterium]
MFTGFAALILVTASARSLAAEVLSWEDCVRETREKNQDLVSAKKKVEEAWADRAVTRSAVLPDVSASSSGTRRSTDDVETTAYSAGVSGQQLVFDGFKASHDLAAARENIKAAEYNYAVTSSNIRLELWSSFIGLLGAQEALRVTQDILDRRQQNVDLVTLRYQVGREHRGALMTAQANLSEAQYDLEEARRNVSLYQRRLVKAMGREVFGPVEVRGDLVVPVSGEEPPSFEKIVEASPLLKQVVAQKESARFGLKAARASLFPKVYINAGATRSGAKWLPETEGWSAGVSMAIPLFEGGKTQAHIRKARSAFERAEADERSERQDVILTLAEAWTQWQNDVSFVFVREEFLRASEERAMIAEGQYSSGLVTFDDWTIIEDDLVNYQKSVLQAKVNALVAEGSWLQAKGVTIDD